MDIQRDEAFEEAYCKICKPIIARPYPRNEKGEYIYKEIHEAHLMWQAKAQAAPEGFVLVPKEPTTHQVDYCQSMKFKKGVGQSHKFEDIFVYKAMIEAQEQSHDGF